MKCHIKYKSESGSVTIEAAVIMPVFIGVLLFFISVFQIVAAENILNISTLRTADKMSKWAPIYKNILVDNFQNEIFEEIFKDKPDDSLMSIINLKKVAEYSLDYIYGLTAQNMCEHDIKENILIKKGIVKINNLNLYKSNFYHNDSNYINVKSVCEVNTYLPFDIKIGTEVKCMAWGKGVMPHVSVNDTTSETLTTDSIWQESNFTRGKILRQMFGGNLPDTFPVIACFENGTASMIKSLNHTAPTYQDSSVFEKAIRRMIDELITFKEGSAGNISVKEKDVIRKRLVLVMPENDLNKSQQKALENIMRYAATKLIVLDLQRYQKV